MGPFEGMNPGLTGSEDCGSLLTNLATEKMITGKYPVRRSLSIQQALEEGELENASWLPGTGNPADGLTRARNVMVPLL